MKKLLTIALASFLMATTTNAQVQRPVDPSQKVQSDNKRYNGSDDLEKIYKDLDLSAAQKTKIKAQIENMRKDKQALDNDKTLTAAQKQQRIADLKKKYRGEIENILTPEQREKVKDIRLDPQTKKRIRNRVFGDDKPRNNGNIRNNGNNGVKMGKYFKELDLTPAQKQSVNKMRQSHKKELDAIHRDASLTQAQKNQKIKALRQSEINELKTILTPEQQVKAKKMLEEYRDGHKDPKGNKGNKGNKGDKGDKGNK